MKDLFYTPTTSEIETRRRIKLSMWAYAYEFLNSPVVSDADFDAECEKIDLSVATARPDMDAWWCKEFQTCTGAWIHNHPELSRIAMLHARYSG